jgi:hypothetical protein
MSRPKPKKLIVEFEDSSRREASFDELPATLGADILRQPFASRMNSHPEQGKFVLIEWEDGWKEVVAVNADCTDINRYRVLTRPEDVGRLSLKRAGGYPELVEITRRPQQVRQITFTDTFALEPGKSLREGKKVEQHFSLRKGGDRLAEIRAELRRVLQEEGTELNEVATLSPDAARSRYEKARQEIGISASRCQQDLIEFMEYLEKAPV